MIVLIIAIVEDLESDYRYLSDLLTRQLHALSVDCELIWFSTGEQFLQHFTEKEPDVVFMDMLLGNGISGMDTVKKLRCISADVPVVFITTEKEYALEGFEVQALDYLIKPVREDRLNSVLKRLLKSGDFNRYITIPVERKNEKIFLSDLITAWASDHSVILYLANSRQMVTHMRFTDFYELLPKEQNFSLSSRGVIVNFDYVDHITDGDFMMQNGMCVPISRANRTIMEKTFSSYAIKKTRGDRL